MPGLLDLTKPTFSPRNITSKAVAYTVLWADEAVQMTGGTAWTFTLPGMDELVNLTVKTKTFQFTNASTTSGINLTLSPGTNGVTGVSQTIGGRATWTLRPGESVQITGKPNGTDWTITSPQTLPAMLREMVCLIATTNGSTTAINLVDASGAPQALTVEGVFVVSQDVTDGNITVVNGTNTVCTIAKGTVAGVMVGEAALTYRNVAAGAIFTTITSTTGNAKVYVFASVQTLGLTG